MNSSRAGAGDDAPLFESKLRSLPLIARGKVRENYAVGSDRMLMVASDPLSAFDVVIDDEQIVLRRRSAG